MNNPKVLLVDDEEMILRAMTRALKSSCTLVTASSVSQALELMATGSFDVILSDVNMPKMNGIEFFNVIKEQHPHMAKKFAFHTGSEELIEHLGVPFISKASGVDIIRRTILELSMIQ